MYRTLEYTILFVVMALLQVFLFSRIGVSVYIHPLAYVAFIILLPMEIAPLLLLTLGLLMGVTMDVFMGTAGINTIATLFVAFCRPTLLNLLAGKDEVKDGGIPNVNRPAGSKNSSNTPPSWCCCTARYSLFSKRCRCTSSTLRCCGSS